VALAPLPQPQQEALADVCFHDVILIWHLDENGKERAKQLDAGACEALIKTCWAGGGGRTHAKIKVWGEIEQTLGNNRRQAFSGSGEWLARAEIPDEVRAVLDLHHHLKIGIV
jgi:hypothetical protein